MSDDIDPTCEPIPVDVHRVDAKFSLWFGFNSLLRIGWSGTSMGLHHDINIVIHFLEQATEHGIAGHERQQLLKCGIQQSHAPGGLAQPIRNRIVK